MGEAAGRMSAVRNISTIEWCVGAKRSLLTGWVGRISLGVVCDRCPPAAYPMNASLVRLLALLAILSPGLVASAAETAPRERLLLDSGWRFHLGDDWGIAQNLAK